LTELRDIRGALPPGNDPMYAAVVVVLVMLAAIAALLFLRRSRSSGGRESGGRDEALPRPATEPSPPKEALGREEYLALTELLRRRLDSTLAVQAPRMTTEELRIGLSGCSGLPDADAEEIVSLLSYADKVKFAGFVPSEAELLDRCKAAGGLIERVSAVAART